MIRQRLTFCLVGLVFVSPPALDAQSADIGSGGFDLASTASTR